MATISTILLKRIFTITLIIISLNICNLSVSEAQITAYGYVYLEYQKKHGNIMMIFEKQLMTGPIIIDTVYSANGGFYNDSLAHVDRGFYNIYFFKDGYISDTLFEQDLFSDRSLPSVTLESVGLSGNLKGRLGPGSFTIRTNAEIGVEDTIIIEPGTKLYFKEEVEFNVRGMIIADGTITDSILLSSHRNSPSWGGINILNTANNTGSLSYCTIENSHSSGIFVDNVSLSMNNLILRNNVNGTPGLSGYGNNEERGGGLYLVEVNSTLNNISCINNKSSKGAGITCAGGNVTIINSSFIDNSATSIGGGIILENNNNSTLTLINTLFNRNSGNLVHSIYNSGVLTIINATIVNGYDSNNPGQGQAIQNDSILKITNSVITNNQGYGVLSNNGIPEIKYSNFWNNSLANFSGCGSSIGKNTAINVNNDSCDIYNNIRLDPMFTNISDNDYSLQEWSNCIDAGSNFPISTANDIIGVTRIIDGDNNGTDIVDLGAFEHQYGGPNIGGYVIAGIDSLKDGLVYLILKDDFNKYSIVDTSILDTKGKYVFYEVAKGQYLVTAILNTNSPFWGEYSPTYFGNDIFWKNAVLITSCATDKDINLILCTVPSSGPGKIIGKARYSTGGNIANLQIMLLDVSNVPLTYTFTDNEGNFNFENLAYGTYYIHVEIPGKNTIPVPITLNSNNTIIDNLVLEIENSTGLTLNTDEIAIIGSIIPNPSLNEAKLRIYSKSETEVVVKIYNLKGQIIDLNKTSFQPGNNYLELNTNRLDKGEYLIIIERKDKSPIIEKFIKLN